MTISKRPLQALLATALTLTTAPTWALGGIAEHAVQFPRGKSGTTIQGALRGGTAAVVVTRPDSRKRTIFFAKGKATGADLSQAEGDTTFRATKEADLFMIRAGRERYELPEAVVSGG